jgi:16S rRNA (guanine(966)-N(2))-methyltransferase RsmD
MRIIGGELRGRRFTGKIPDNVRPTTEAAREAIYNTLNNYIDFDQIVVADICAGMGALGIEALSRGADFCFFFEKNKKTAYLLEEVLNYFKIDDSRYEIIIGDAVKNLVSSADYLKNKIDLVLMDPPYEFMLCNQIIHNLVSLELMTEGAIIVAEHHLLETIDKHENIEKQNSKIYGTTAVDFLKYL